MGQKVNPHGLRVGVIKDWDSKWYAGKEQFADYLAEDHNIRTYVKKKLYSAGVSHVVIERSGDNKMRIVISTARPGMVIGRSGAGIDQLKADLEKMTDKKISISIEEVRRSEMDAQLTAESVAEALEHRISFRRAMKQAIGRTMKSGAKGIKILCSGRLGGAEIARKEQYSEGNVPLHTLRADIDYGFAEADTTYGRIGVKVWINHGEILDKGLQSTIREDKREGGRKDRRGRRDDRRGGRRKFDRRDDHRAAKAVNPRKRKAPKAAPKAEQAESAPAEAQETNE
jgi:small subunit ribosomal protein S3